MAEKSSSRHDVLNSLAAGEKVTISACAGSMETDAERAINASHGGLVWLADGQRGPCIDFSANIWPYPLDHSALQDSISKLDAYPDPEYRGLVAAVANHYGVDPSQVFPANGSTEALYLAMLALKPRRVAIFEPTFSEYARAAQWAAFSNVEVIRITGDAENDFRPVLEVPAADVAVLCNPNNPTGAYLPRSEVLSWVDACSKRGVWVIIDEAFVEFVEELRASLVHELNEQRNLLILRSMTKYFGIPGLRLGFAVGASEIMARVWAKRIPWSVNTVAQQMGIQFARNAAPQTTIAATVASERAFLSEGLRKMGWQVLPSAANFVLGRLRDKRSNGRLLSCLLQQGFLLRNAANFYGLDDSYVRCAVKERPQNESLLKAIARCV
jgi:threonine-phosphate decarboxylase